MEILPLISEGLKNKEIGENLFISPETVKTHIRHIYEKLGIENKSQLFSLMWKEWKSRG